MPVTDVNSDLDALTMTITAELDAGVERAWELWSDPRQLERWWGPPSHPSTFEDYDLAPGERISYVMTAPDGEETRGRWRVDEVEPPNRLRLADDETNEEGEPNDGGPTEMTVSIVALDGKAKMSIESSFASRATLERMIEMGMEQGFTETVARIDGLLGDGGR